jgi:hypothetical protein
METETILLVADDPLMPFVADVPVDAKFHRVPNQGGINPRIRGLTFERTGLADKDFGLPLFRKKSRQL